MEAHESVDEASPRTAAFERRLLLKLDCWILPTLSLVFLWSYIDKTNLGNAKIYGLTEDLELTGTKFNTALVVYFVAYCLFHVPATLGIRKIRPSIYLPSCMFVYGAISLSMGFVHSYGALLATRFCLGIAEAASFSCSFYLIAQWYKRAEAQKRFTFFYCTVQLGGAFSGLIAYAIGHIHDLRGLAPWRWIFIIEGACTSGVALLMFFILPDFPEQSKWISQRKKDLLLRKLEEDRHEVGSSEMPLTARRVFQVISQPKVLLAGLYYLSSVVPTYAYSYFAPSIIHSYTTGAIRTQLISVPPWVCGFAAALSLAALGDRLRHRASFAIAPLCLAVVGYAVLLRIHGEGAARTQYAMMFLVVLGQWTALPIVICWTTMNVLQPADRAVAMGWIIGFANIGGMPAAYLFQEDHYKQGFAISLGLVLATMTLGLLYTGVCWLENRKRLRGCREQESVDVIHAEAKGSPQSNEVSRFQRAGVLNMI